MKNPWRILLSILLLSIYSISNNLLSAKIVDPKTVSFISFGGNGDGVTDNSVALQNAIFYCIKNNKTLYIPKTDKFYVLKKTVRIPLTKGDQISITSNHAILKPMVTDIDTAYKLTAYKEHVYLSIGRSFSSIETIDQPDQLLGTSISISGLILDGVNQNTNDNIISYNNDIYIGAQFVAQNVEVRDCTFQNIVGYGVRIHEATNSTLINSNFLNVGGRGYTQFVNKVDLDAFGDAIYFAKLNTNATVKVENCTLKGKKKYNYRSRVGLTFEFNKNTYKANLNNLKISGYAKGIHLEEKASSTINLNQVTMSDFNFGITNVLNDSAQIYLNNSTLNVGLSDGNDRGDALAFLNYMSNAKIYVNNSTLSFNGKTNAYQSVGGLVSVKNSVINGNNTNFFFADGNTIFSKCKFINFGGANKSFFSINPNNLFQLNSCSFSNGSILKVKAFNVKLQMINSTN